MPDSPHEGCRCAGTGAGYDIYPAGTRRYHKSSERFISEPSKVIGSKVQVKVESVEYYSPKAKDYYGRKEIREVEFLK